MDPLTAQQRGEDAFASILGKISGDQVDAPTPCTDWTVRDVVAHVVTGNYRVAGQEAPPLPQDRDGLIEAHAGSATAALDALGAPGGLEKEYEFPFGTVTGAALARMRARDALVHSWDLAKATGQSTDIDPELSSEMLEFSQMQITEAHRGPGRPFGDEQPVLDVGSATDRLAAFLGRSVD